MQGCVRDSHRSGFGVGTNKGVLQQKAVSSPGTSKRSVRGAGPQRAVLPSAARTPGVLPPGPTSRTGGGNGGVGAKGLRRVRHLFLPTTSEIGRQRRRPLQPPSPQRTPGGEPGASTIEDEAGRSGPTYTLGMRPKMPTPMSAIACAVMASTVIACGSGSGAEQLSDAAKRERVRALYEEYRKSFPTIQSLTVEELLELQSGSSRVVLVDVREPEEMKVSMIPGAIDATTFHRQAQSYREAIVVPYCTVGYRSGLFTQELQKAGWDVRNLEGSILAWTLAGLPLENAEGPTKRIHVYGRTWDLAAHDFSSVW